VSVRRDETEATNDAERLVFGALVLQLCRLLPLLTVALLITEVIPTYPYIVHLLLVHDCDIIWIRLRRRENAGYECQNDKHLRDEEKQDHFVEEDKNEIVLLYGVDFY